MVGRSKYDLGMPIDLATPAAHVGDKLDRANGALSGLSLAEGYEHSVRADLQRVQARYGLDSDEAAVRWMVDYVAKSLNHVIAVEGGYQLAEGFGFDDLKWNGRKLQRRQQSPRLEKLSRFFDPLISDAEARRRPLDGIEELRDSLRAGWDRRLGGPIVIDNRGVVLSGRRRKMLADELGLDLPTDAVVRETLPNTDEGNLRRWWIMTQANTGRPWTPAERKYLIELLADMDGKLPEGVTQDNLAKAFGVSQKSISNDLMAAGFSSSTKRGKHVRKPKPSKPKKSEVIQPKVAEAMDSAGCSSEVNVTGLAEDLGVPRAAVREAVAREEGARAERERQATASSGCAHSSYSTVCVCDECGAVV